MKTGSGRKSAPCFHQFHMVHNRLFNSLRLNADIALCNGGCRAAKAFAPKRGTIKSLAKAAVFLVFWYESVKNDVYSKLFLTFCVYI